MTSVPPNSDGLTSRDFPVHWPVLTRWADNDMFGHLNNAVYYQLFDTAINGWISTHVDVDPVTTTAQGIVADFEAYPQWNKEIKGLWVLHRYPDGRPSQ